MRGKKPCLLSRCLAALLAAVLVIGLVGYAPEAKAATKEITEDAFLKAANSKIGSATAQGMCLGWVRSFWVGLGAESSTSCCAHNYSLGSGRIVSTSKNNIPIGANIYFRGGSAKCVYSNGGGCGRICGHIGIHMGDGKVISARKLVNQSACVGVETISKWESWGYTYVGWGWHTGVKVVSDYSTVDSTTRIGISIKSASGDDQCYIKKEPFEDSITQGVVGEGGTIKIVGAVKNKHGNTWYETEDGGFVYSGDIIFYQDYFSISAKFKNTERRSSHKLPFVDSDEVKKIGKDDVVQVSKFVLNSYGNIWAQLTDGSYLCFYDKETGENKLQFSSHVTKPTHSTTYPQGDIKVTSSYGFLFKGDVKAEVPFLSLTARVIDRETEKDVSVTGSPCTLKPAVSTRTINLEKTTIDGKTMDSIVLIRKLNGSSGWYRYELNAQFGFTYNGKTFKFGNEYNLVSSDFTVGNPGTLETTPTPEVKGNLTIGNATKNGDVLEIPVGIQGNPGLMGIGIKVDLPEDFWNFNVSPVDIGKDAIPYTEGVNGGDTVALMSMGTMTGDGNLFKIHVSTAGLDLTEFTLKVTCVSAGDANGKDVMFNGAEKVIQLVSNRIPGDADDNGTVDWADVILALKHAMKLNVAINTSNADVTADNTVNWNDVILLLKYVMKLNVELK